MQRRRRGVQGETILRNAGRTLRLARQHSYCVFRFWLHVPATPAARAREVGSRLAPRTEAIGAVGNVILAHLYWADSCLEP